MTITEMKKKFIAAGIDDMTVYNWFYCVFDTELSKLEICNAVTEAYDTEFLFIHRDDNNSFIGVDSTIIIDPSFSEACTVVYTIENDPVEEETP